MKTKLFLASLFLFFTLNAFSQPLRVAILDFDNISGIAKYDGLGKAMSSMLISDIESNVSQKRLQLVERSQINKIMKEQNLQKSASFDKNTSVKIGKLLGVNFLLIGDIYILDNSLVINARLTDASSGDIKFSEKQEGKINEWLTVKSKLGKSVSTSISMPFTEPRIPDAIISPAVLTTYANAIDENDKGNIEKAETLINTAKEYNPEFRYLDDLRDEVNKLKKQFGKLQIELETSVENPISASTNFIKKQDFKTAIKYLLLGLSRLDNNGYGEKYIYFRLLSENYYMAGNYDYSINYSDSILEFYKYDDNAIYYKTLSLIKKGKSEDGIKLFKNQLINYQKACESNEYNKQIDDFEKLKNIHFSGVKVSNFYDCPFLVTKDANTDIEGEYFYQGIFSRQLHRYVEVFQYLKKSPSQIAEELISLKIKDKLKVFPNLRIEKPFYLPSSRYSLHTTPGNEFIVAETGQEYIGNYFATYDGKKYTGSAPSVCPCQLLFTKPEHNLYIKATTTTNELTLENNFERERVFQLGWLYLLAKNPEKSIKQYSSLIDYFEKKVKNFSDFQKLSGLEKNLWRMSKINIGHAYLLNNDMNKALDYYVKTSLNDKFDGFNGMSAKEVIISDWKDLIGKGVFKNNFIEEFKIKSNKVFD